MQGVIAVARIAFKSGKERWYSVATLFLDTLPTLSVYSAMKLLDKIVPSVISAAITQELAIASDRKGKGASACKAYQGVIQLVLKTAACFLVGFDVFLLRLRITMLHANRAHLGINDLVALLLF